MQFLKLEHKEGSLIHEGLVPSTTRAPHHACSLAQSQSKLCAVSCEEFVLNHKPITANAEVNDVQSQVVLEYPQPIRCVGYPSHVTIMVTVGTTAVLAFLVREPIFYIFYLLPPFSNSVPLLYKLRSWASSSRPLLFYFGGRALRLSNFHCRKLRQ